MLLMSRTGLLHRFATLISHSCRGWKVPLEAREVQEEILFGNFTSSDQKEPVQQFLFCQPAGFMAGHSAGTKTTLKSTNNSRQ